MVSLVLENLSHGFVSNAMQSREGSHSHIGNGKFISELSCLRIGENASRAITALPMVNRWLATATLLEHVLSVIFCCAEKQVVGIATRGIIAFMETVKVIGDRAIVKLVRVAVSAHIASVYPKLTVAIWLLASLPFPTFVRAALVELFPEANFGRAHGAQSYVMTNNKAYRLTFDMTQLGIAPYGNGREFSATAFAKSARVWGVLGRVLLPSVPIEVAKWFALDPSLNGVCAAGQVRGLPASAFTEFWGNLLCVHKGNYTANYTSGAWQKVDSFLVPTRLVLSRIAIDRI